MKNSILKLLCLALSVVMIFSIAGCGKTENKKVIDTGTENFDIEGNVIEQGGKDETASGDNATTATQNKESGGKVTAATISKADELSWKQLVIQMPSSLKNTTITMCNWNAAKEYTGSEKVIKDFEKQTGIKVKWVVAPYDNYTSKIAAMINAGNSPDLIRMYSPDPHRMNLCQDVKTATGYDFKGDIWDQRVNKEYTIKNKVYAVNLNDTFFNQPKVMMYKKSVIQTLKIEDPYKVWKQGKWNWNKFIEICKAYLKVKPDGNAWISYNAIDYLSFSGRELIELENNKYVNKINNAQVYKDLQQMCNLSAQGILSEAVRDDDIFNSNALFMTFNSIANRRTNANLMEIKGNDDLFCVPIPEIKGREKVQEYSELEAYGIPKGAKNAPSTYYFLRYFLDANNYNANEFFCNKQAYEVYKACREKKEVFASTAGNLTEAVSKDGANFGGLTDFIRLGGSVSQLKSQLDKSAPTLNLATKKANEVLKEFK